MAKAAILNIDILATADKALDAFDKVKGKSTDSFTAMKVGANIAAGAVIAGLADATNAAAAHETAVARVTTAYNNASVPTKNLTKDLDEVEAASRRNGASTEDSIAAYGRLVTATGSTADAHKDLALAQDLAVAKGISVGDATDAVIKTTEGSTKALKALGIETSTTGNKQLDAKSNMESLTLAVQGQADAFGNTATGQMARFHESLDQTKEKVGEALLPALKSVIDMLQPLFNWLSNNTGILQVLAPILAVVAGVIVTVTAATKAWAVIQGVLNAVMDANPIGLIILAIAGLIAGVILAYQHFAIFRNAINDVWNFLQNLGAWIAAHWKLIVDMLLGPVGILLTNLNTVKGVIGDIIGALESIGHAVSDALGWLGKIPKGVGGVLSSLNPFSAAAPGPAATTMVFQITATPGADLPETVYQALRDYQRRHVRPELRPLFG
jgi:hypothetical protein